MPCMSAVPVCVATYSIANIGALASVYIKPILAKGRVADPVHGLHHRNVAIAS